MSGPLSGVRVIEFAGLGPGPFCAMMLADHGAEVIRIDRPGAAHDPFDILARSRRSVALDMKAPEGIAVARDLVRSADAIVEGFRPGVMERLGLGPDVLLADNPKLVYGRMTGWGQDGPLASAAGHDINYIALAGVLHTCGQAGGKPVPPVNYLGDFGGGGMMLALGIVSALLAVRMGGEGQVIDAAMVNGASLLGAMTRQFYNAGAWNDAPGTNAIDGGAPFYDTYECADGRWVSIGSIEPQFYALLRRALGIADDSAFDGQMDRDAWPALKARLAAIFLTRSRDEWTVLMEGTDICYAPVLSLGEAPDHPHNVARGTFVDVDGAVHPAPAPRFSATPLSRPTAARKPGADADAVLQGLGYTAERIAALTPGVAG